MSNQNKSFLKRKIGPFAVQMWLVILGFVAVSLFAAEKFGLLGFKAKESVKLAIEDDQKIILNTAPANYKESVGEFSDIVFPDKTQKSKLPGAVWNLGTIPWQGVAPIIYANGGALTMKNSLMEKAGVRMNIQRVDDYGIHYDRFAEFATAFKDAGNDPDITKGLQFTIFMGDAAGWYMDEINSRVSKVDPEFKGEIFYISGGSLGEDGYFGPPGFFDNPNEARGSVCAAVKMDGDQNIVLLWAEQNGIPVNSDPHTFDPNAINFVETGDFVSAVDAFIGEQVINRPEVKNGKKTGKMSGDIRVNSFATWTPGDVYFYEEYKGKEPVVRVMSTYENRNQMLTTVVGLNKHLEGNRDKVIKMLLAFDKAANQMKTYDEVLREACNTVADVYEANKPSGEDAHDGAWWYRYYKGDTVRFNGVELALGGSMAKNLSEAADAFGVGLPEATGYYKEVYKTFADMYVKLYPEDLKSYAPADEVFNGRYIEAALNEKKESKEVLAEETEVTYKTGEETKTYASRDWSIEFSSGKSDLTAKGKATLEEAYGQLVVSQNLRIKLTGYTDTDGDDEFNLTLSEKRAKSVQKWFMSRGGKNFQANRFAKVEGQGESDKYSNATSAGKAKNRRVEIALVD